MSKPTHCCGNESDKGKGHGIKFPAVSAAPFTVGMRKPLASNNLLEDWVAVHSLTLSAVSVQVNCNSELTYLLGNLECKRLPRDQILHALRDGNTSSFELVEMSDQGLGLCLDFTA